MSLQAAATVVIAILMFVMGAVEEVAAQDRSEDLNRPVRVLISGVSDDFAHEVSTLDSNRKIDFSYPSKKLSDFDLMVILVDEFNDALDEKIVRELGFVPDDFPDSGERNFVAALTVEFEGDEMPFPILVIDRRHFYSRERACHAPLLRDFILQADWFSIIEREHEYKLASDCKILS